VCFVGSVSGSCCLTVGDELKRSGCRREHVPYREGHISNDVVTMNNHPKYAAADFLTASRLFWDVLGATKKFARLLCLSEDGVTFFRMSRLSP